MRELECAHQRSLVDGFLYRKGNWFTTGSREMDLKTTEMYEFYFGKREDCLTEKELR